VTWIVRTGLDCATGPLSCLPLLDSRLPNAAAGPADAGVSLGCG